jgi:hypothetical protein
MGPGIRGFLIFLAAFGLFLVVFLGIFFFFYRSLRIIRASQPPLMAMVLVGEALAAIRVVNGTRNETDSVCDANAWLGHLAFVMVFGGLCLKMWRVDKIINQKSFKRVKITDFDMFIRAMIAIIFIVGFLIAITVAGKPYAELRVDNIRNTDYYITECKQEIVHIESALFAIEAVFLLWGIRLCNATKDAPSTVNESLIISISASIIIVIAGVLIPVIYLLELDAVTVSILSGLGFSFAQIFTTATLFIPNALAIFTGKHEPDKNKIVANAFAGNMVSPDGRSSDSYDAAAKVLLQACAKAMHNLSPDERCVLGHNQIDYWRGILLRLDEAHSQAASQKGSVLAGNAFSVDKTSEAASEIASSYVADDKEGDDDGVTKNTNGMTTETNTSGFEKA